MLCISGFSPGGVYGGKRNLVAIKWLNPAHWRRACEARRAEALACCIGNEFLKPSDRESLQALTDELKGLSGDIKDDINDDINDIDGSLVKDQILRLSAKWTFLISDMSSYQSSLLMWSQSVAPNIHEIKAGEEAAQPDRPPMDRQSKDRPRTYKPLGDYLYLVSITTTRVVTAKCQFTILPLELDIKSSH